MPRKTSKKNPPRPRRGKRNSVKKMIAKATQTKRMSELIDRAVAEDKAKKDKSDDLT